MLPRKRLLKKEKHVQAKKRMLFISFITGLLGFSLIGVGILVLLKEPPFISPLPIFRPLQADAESKAKKKDIERLLKEKNIEYENIQQVKSGIYTFDVSGHGEVTISTKKELNPQLSSLQVILVRLTMEGKKFKRLDVRFDRPIIVLQ